METRVVKILSDTTVVLAAGAEQHVREGQGFVLYELGDEIIDPETKESLGCLEVVKGRVEVVHVMDKMCIARTKSKTERRSRLVGGLADAMAAIRPREEAYEVEVGQRLKVAESDKTFESRLFVRVGDRARSVD